MQNKNNMIYRFLGPTGIKVSVISYGNWLNSNSQEALEKTCQCVKAAWDLGINFFDTAEVYGYGEAEKQIGIALKRLNIPRHHFVLSTKIFWQTSQHIPNRRGLSRKHVIEGLRSSLKKLDYDYVDVVFCHRPDFETPIEETCRAFDWVIRKGLAFYWGTSEWNQYEIAEAHMICEKYGLIKPVVEQPQYNIYNREKLEIKYAKLFQKNLLGTTIWSPLLSGILTGKYNNGIPEGARFDTNPTMIGIYNRYFTDKKDQTIESLRKFGELAKELDCNMAQLALAWVIANPDVSTAITGASSPSQLQDSVKSIDLITKLTPEIQVRIEDIFQTSPFGKRNMKTMQKETSRRRAILKY